eukprot:gnl/TRDRNA2_/TRDRNA2_42191_c0_seq1.p1 gnl/TRDRNA2_/TRDRNA2_42191_c0~~gnl/TRDRNA2_/TRDRNA2_42191_c0_seq1.p1  ORF type:complete len:318 (+),score=58.69 gnl/TRDRNA2_/TRDRNA2_42191_c0_seq1:53-1006(+)
MPSMLGLICTFAAVTGVARAHETPDQVGPAPLPGPAGIAKEIAEVFCDIYRHGQARNASVIACEKVQEHYPSLPMSVCEAIITKAFGVGGKMCPTTTTTTTMAPVEMSPGDIAAEIGEVFCDIVRHTGIQNPAMIACAALQEKHPHIGVSSCKPALEEVFDSKGELCPKVDVLPETLKRNASLEASLGEVKSEIGQVFCELVKRGEPLAIIACFEANKNHHWFPLSACKMFIEGTFGAAGEFCSDSAQKSAESIAGSCASDYMSCGPNPSMPATPCCDPTSVCMYTSTVGTYCKPAWETPPSEEEMLENQMPPPVLV